MKSAFMDVTDHDYKNESRKGATTTLFRMWFNREL